MSAAAVGALSAVIALLASAAGAGAGDITRHVLSNGVRVLVREDASAGVVAASLQVRAGSRYETPQTAGMTNLLHRAMVRGAGRRSGAELAEAAEAIGGRLDAGGDVETAEVRGTALAAHWQTLLGLVADVALAPTLAREEVDKERRLVLGQIQTRLDTPFPRALDALLADLYGAHAYALPAIGRRESVERMDRERLLAHHRAVYRPDRLVLAVSGRVPAAGVVRTAEKLFGGWRVDAAPAADAPERPAPAAGGRRVITMPAQQAQILVGCLGPALADADAAAMKVLAAVMGGGMAGRLFVALRDREGLAYSLGVLNPWRTGPAPFIAYLGTARENVAAAEEGMLRELERVRAEGVSDGELERAKTYAAATLAMDRRTNARWAWYLAFFEAVGAGWDFPDRYARAVEAVTAADVGRVARRYLVRPTIVVLEPD